MSGPAVENAIENDPVAALLESARAANPGCDVRLVEVPDDDTSHRECIDEAINSLEKTISVDGEPPRLQDVMSELEQAVLLTRKAMTSADRDRAATRLVPLMMADAARRTLRALYASGEPIPDAVRHEALMNAVALYDEQYADAPFALLSYEALLWPRRVRELDTRFVPADLHAWLRERARSYLAQLEADPTRLGSADTRVLRAHWTSIGVDGTLPPPFLAASERSMPRRSFSLQELLTVPGSSTLHTLRTLPLFQLSLAEACWLRERAAERAADEALSTTERAHAAAIAAGTLPYGFCCPTLSSMEAASTSTTPSATMPSATMPSATMPSATAPAVADEERSSTSSV